MSAGTSARDCHQEPQRREWVASQSNLHYSHSSIWPFLVTSHVWCFLFHLIRRCHVISHVPAGGKQSAAGRTGQVGGSAGTQPSRPRWAGHQVQCHKWEGKAEGILSQVFHRRLDGQTYIIYLHCLFLTIVFFYLHTFYISCCLCYNQDPKKQ